MRQCFHREGQVGALYHLNCLPTGYTRLQLDFNRVRTIVHDQEGGVAALDLEDTPNFTLVSPCILPLDSEDGEVLAIRGQPHALIELQGVIVGDPVDGNIYVLGVTVEAHPFPVLYGSALADCNGGLGQ